MGIYTVTYCATDPEVGSNPFWHSALILSMFNEKIGKLEVVNIVGFGGVPATHPWENVRQLKKQLGVDADFYGNHGLFYSEELRHFEQGFGLHGVTFELTEEKFNALQNKYQHLISQQKAAIDEAANELKLTPKASGYRNYPYEEHSLEIYQHELEKAKKNQFPPRLLEFSILIFSAPYLNCKARILSLLDDILSPQQIELIKGWHEAIPYLSSNMETIYLHTDGPLHEHHTRSGGIAHYRKINEAKIYWTLPPQHLDALSETTSQLFKMNEDHCEAVKTIVRKLQSLEWYFRNLTLDESLESARVDIINEIIKLYEAFAILEPKAPVNFKNDWNSFFRYLSSQPRDKNEKLLLEKMTLAENFLNQLYFAVIDLEEEDLTNHTERESDLETLLVDLTSKEKEKLCHLLKRQYLAPECEMNRMSNNK